MGNWWINRIYDERKYKITKENTPFINVIGINFLKTTFTTAFEIFASSNSFQMLRLNYSIQEPM